MEPSPKDITGELQQADKADGEKNSKDKDTTVAEWKKSSDAIHIKNNMTSGLWMPRPVIKTKTQLEGLGEGLEYLIPLNRIYIYPRIKMIDELYDNPKKSRNMLTIRNDAFQIIYYVATSGDKKPGITTTFKYRIIDQIGRHVLTLSKLFYAPCFGRVEADVRSPPGTRAAIIRQFREDEYSVKYQVMNSTGLMKFEILRKDLSDLNKFDIMTGSDVVGSIAKRIDMEKKPLTVYDGPYVRLDFQQDLPLFDKMVALSTALLINIVHFQKSKK